MTDLEMPNGKTVPKKIVAGIGLGLVSILVLIVVPLIGKETSPSHLLSRMTTEDQVVACEYTLEKDGSKDNDYWIVDSFEEIVRTNLDTNNFPAIDYSDEIHEDDYYSDIFGKSDYERSVAANDIDLACFNLRKENSQFSQALDDLDAKKEAIATAKAKKKAEAKAKIQPLLDKWNKKASAAGGGDIADYLAAESDAEYRIKSGASYSFTGADAQISNVSCYPTTLSNWFGGNASGWWSCLIQTLGGEFDLYSIQFSGSSWGGKPDNGRMAGSDLNWTIPDSLMEWLQSN